MFLIYIVKTRERAFNILFTSVIAGMLIYLIHQDSSLLTSTNLFVQGICSHLSFNHSLLNHFMIIILARPLLDVYAFMLWVLLWGLKHKLIATWTLFTFWGTTLLGLGMNHLMFATTNITVPVIDLTFLKLLILGNCIYISLLPNLRRRYGYGIMLLLVLVILLRCLAGIQLHTISITILITSVLSSYIFTEVFAYFYLHLFCRWQRLKLFRHSDFN